MIFDSGTVALSASADLLLGAVINTGANQDASPISLMVVNGDQVAEAFDVDQSAGVRVGHNSANAPEVDVLVNDAKVFSNLAFTETVPSAARDSYAALPGGETNVKVAVSADNTLVPIDADLLLVNGQGYTALAIGLVGDVDTPIEALVLEDSVRSIATQASLRVVHGSTAAGNVNVYLLPEGQETVGNATPVLADAPYKAVTGYLPVAADTYNLVVTDADGNAAIGPAEITLDAGAVYTAVARDGQQSGSSSLTDFGLILLDDFVPQPTQN
ncbi:MAG: DUF4397 domain-containing protein [Oleiphilaceae bacterium]|nr:DUF4397 domain-containing protein [Oleiphilaceae bacterium]